jgi:hypothetical protein
MSGDQSLAEGIQMRIAALMVLVLTACGGTDFTGTYVGPITTTESCPGQPPSVTTADATFAITQANDELKWNNGTCPGNRAAVSGNAAIVESNVCEPHKTDSYTSITTRKSGTLALNGSALTVSLSLVFDIAFTDGSRETCTGDATGTLARKAE